MLDLTELNDYEGMDALKELALLYINAKKKG